VMTALSLSLAILRHQILNFKSVKPHLGLIKGTGMALLIFAILFSTIIAGQPINLVHAQTDSTITIRSDGSVEGTDLIQREGNIYTFTGNIFGTIKVEKDDITIDGAGYATKGNGNGINLRKDSTAIPPAYGDVVVKNVRFCDNGRISASSKGNSFINNVFEGGGIDIKGIDAVNKVNVIKYNVFIDGKPAISSDYSDETVVTENDFINCRIFLAAFGRLDFDRNYWSDYTTLYPDAKEIGHTGIWDTPYNYDKTDWSDFPFVDSNPLVNHANGTGAPPGVTDKPAPTPTAATDTNESETFSTAVIIVAVIVSVVVVSTSLRVYFKKHK